MLAVVGLLALAVGMYTTYNLARSVYEKIQLQNAADAAAYSLATLEARTFNFIAFSNRAQVANYVQMMELEAYFSNLLYIEAFAIHMGDKMRGLEKLSAARPEVAEGFRIAAEGFEAQQQLVQTVLTPLDDSGWYQRALEFYTAKNYALFGVSAALAVSTLMQIQNGAEQIVKGNDPDAEAGAAGMVLSGMNAASYAMAFDLAALGDGEAGDKADRMMAELANASRWGLRDPKLLLSRSRFEVFGDLITALQTGPTGSLGGTTGKVLDEVFSWGFTGTTKLLTDESEFDALLNETREAEAEHSALARGGALVSKDHASLMGPERLASVISAPDRSRVCRYTKPSLYGSIIRIPLPPDESAIKCKENQHLWRGPFGLLPGGMTPYLKFAARETGISAEATSFNQPDVWILLSKSPERMGTGGGVEDLRFSLHHGNQSAELDGLIGEGGLFASGFGKGLHALSRAQVYYHRPGAWQEPPNFFNPFWGARLAPKGAAIKRLLGVPGLSGVAADLVADNVWMF